MDDNREQASEKFSGGVYFFLMAIFGTGVTL
jgi:hypothetical protein